MPNNDQEKAQILEIEIVESEKTLYNGKAKSLSSKNPEGKFDILPGHRSFISIIEDEIKIRTDKGEDLTFKIEKGVLKCFHNKIEILVGLDSLENLDAVTGV